MEAIGVYSLHAKSYSATAMWTSMMTMMRTIMLLSSIGNVAAKTNMYVYIYIYIYIGPHLFYDAEVGSNA